MVVLEQKKKLQKLISYYLVKMFLKLHDFKLWSTLSKREEYRKMKNRQMPRHSHS